MTLALEGLDAPETEKAHGALDERVRPAAGVSECALSLSLNRPPKGLSCKKTLDEITPCEALRGPLVIRGLI